MELTKANGFCEMNEMEMQEIDGGSTKVASGVFTIGAGFCFIISGVCLLVGNDKASAGWGIAGGTCGVIAGGLAAIPAP